MDCFRCYVKGFVVLMSRQRFENFVFYDAVPGYEEIMEIQINFFALFWTYGMLTHAIIN